MKNATCCALSLVLVAVATPAAALSLYDPAAGSLPAAQGWSTLGSGAAASQSVANGLLHIDTSAAGVGAFVHALATPQPLDTEGGFQLRWQLQVISEQHSSDNRAGFSLLLQGADQRQSLELGFWQDSVWALAYQGGGADSGFVRAETAALDTTAALRQYTLTVQQGGFSLVADGQPLLAAALRDYPVLGLSTLPYGQSNALFLGDNSTRGQSVVQLGAITLLPVPEPATLALWTLGLGLGLLGWRTGWRRP